MNQRKNKKKMVTPEKAVHEITNLNVTRQVTWGGSGGPGYFLGLIWLSVSVIGLHQAKILSFLLPHQGYFQNYNLLQFPKDSVSALSIFFPLLTHIMPTRLYRLSQPGNGELRDTNVTSNCVHLSAQGPEEEGGGGKKQSSSHAACIRAI